MMPKQLAAVALLLLAGCQQQPPALTESQMREMAFVNEARSFLTTAETGLIFARTGNSPEGWLSLHKDLEKAIAKCQDARHDKVLYLVLNRMEIVSNRCRSISEGMVLKSDFSQLGDADKVKELSDRVEKDDASFSEDLTAIKDNLAFYEERADRNR